MNRNIKDLGKLIFKKKVYILLITIIFMVTGMSYSYTNVEYRASQKILVDDQSSHLINTYQEIIKGSMALEEVNRNLNLNMNMQELSEFIKVSHLENTNMLEIKVTGENAEMVQNISNEISKVFLKKVDEIYQDAELYPVDEVADYYTKGNVIIVGICSGIVGFILTCLLFAISWLFNTKIKSCKDIEEITGLKSLISIPNIKLIVKKKLTIKNIRAHKSEVFKLLMTNIQFVNTNHLQSQSILLTSPKSAEGKTYVATNLAIEFAKAGKKVILVDGDMKRGRIAKIFNLPNDLGFSNYLSNLDSNGNYINERINRFINDTEIKNLNVITSGNVPPNPTELLETKKVDELIKDLKIFYDVVLIDTVSILDAPGAKQLAKRCDLSLILSSYGNTRKEELRKAYQTLSEYARNCIGMGFNKIPDTKIRKEMLVFKNQTKKRMTKLKKQFQTVSKIMLKLAKKIGKLFQKMGTLGHILKSAFLKLFAGLVVGKKVVMAGVHKVLKGMRKRTESMREYIQKRKKKKESIKLIDAGKWEEPEGNNIIKEVFEEKIAHLETSNEVEYRKKLDTLRANIEIKTTEELPKVRPVVTKPKNQPKSKFDLIREQQQKETQENAVKEPTLEETKVVKEETCKVEIQPIVNNHEVKQEKVQEQAIQEKKSIEENKQEFELKKAKKQEKKKTKQEILNQYEEIDLSKQEEITEEMIRRQVEMDEMVRLAEKEEEEEMLRMRRMKKEERIVKNKERKEKIKNFFQFMREEKKADDFEQNRIRKMEAKIEEKIKRENEKNEMREKVEKEKAERKAYREIQKQRQREELRIQEELQEDNLYPRPRI